ncbi:MAG: hypothetical protein K2X87_20380 [Gemmataceae bacterium]|nr:hypothetical protein [Gemmataceae bacterium]
MPAETRLAFVSGAVAALALLLPSAAGAGVITFEVTPAGTTPVDNTPLDAPYLIDGGGTVRFFFDANGNNVFDAGIDALPFFEAAGDSDPISGFANHRLRRRDTADPGFESQLGGYFLRPETGTSDFLPPFVVDYDTPRTIRSLSGEIWDIDGNLRLGTEQWVVDVLDGSGAVLASTLSPLGLGGALDGAPWTFAFTGLPDGVDKLRLTFVGTKRDGIGLAFNNYNPTFAAPAAVPEPMSLTLLTFGGVSLVAARRLRRS